MAAIARVGDSVSCVCNGHGGTTRTGTIQTGSSTMSVSGTPVARVGDTGILDCGHSFTITTGSAVGRNAGTAIARVGDTVVSSAGGSGTITSGAANANTL